MADATNDQKPLKVLIVGGGIAGLTLANALQHAPANIEYLILEARDTLAPQLGAGIALVPNGSRILDQLGIYADLEPGFDPIVSSSVLDANGRALLPERVDGAKLLGVRMSYPLALVQRVTILQSLERRLQPGKGQILTGKKCTDGSSYRGDIIVGADGVRSTVRREMWRSAEEQGLSWIDVGKEKRAMTAEYKCLFGISKPVMGLGPGTSDDTWIKDKCIVVYSGERGKLFWFLYGRMDRVYGSHEIPRYNDGDASKFAHENLDLPLRPGGSIKFADVWDAREVATMLPLEEANFAHWTVGRIVCLGDSVHKMTPHTGAGGMLCIETAAALANTICRLATETQNVDGKTSPTLSQVEAALRRYENGPNNLHGRAAENIKESSDLAHLSSLQTFWQRLLVPYLVPMSIDSRVDLFCDMSVGAPCIEYLPTPPRSITGTMPFNPTHGMTKHEKKWQRAIFAAPLLALAVVSFVVIAGLVPFEPIREVLNQGIYYPENGSSVSQVSIIQRLYQISFVDDFTRIGNLEFVVSRVNCFLLMLSFYADYGVWYAITLIESVRRANHLTILTPILIWGMLNMRGIALFGALYKFAHYILSPIAVFDASDMRLTDKTYTSIALPAILITHYATYLSAYLAPDEAHRQVNISSSATS
ncbi:hypothetical protein ONZ43_g7285 [Nemania bipapillata]|uniref:Uncharacterized protein n=1 Tax=Nemania bipapillata TaxID=110536 RepID=A0ACC2HRS6_9PEZI|nr:hypothetical protein ONZ43_g7285 [Nemania bipapillata]